MYKVEEHGDRLRVVNNARVVFTFTNEEEAFIVADGLVKELNMLQNRIDELERLRSKRYD